MQIVDTDQNWHSQFRPSAHGHGTNFFYKIFYFCFVILGLSFNFQTYVLSNSWDSLTNHCFFGPRPWPNRPLAEKKNFLGHTFLPKWTQKKFRPKRVKGGRVTESQSHRVTESQSHRVTESHHFHSLLSWVKFFMPIFNKLPYSLRSQGDNAAPIYLGIN